MAPNSLYFGDNLDVLRQHIRDESIDLVYLDPPFNSNADYGMFFKERDGQTSQAMIEAFEDTWTWSLASEAAFDDVVSGANTQVAEVMRALREFLGDNDMMAYLAMMAVRLVELHRVLKRTGSLYLHCDPTASHYLKILLDSIFGKQNFLGEIIWRRTSGKVSTRRWVRLHDTILCYAKEPNSVIFHPPKVTPDAGWIEREYRFKDERGRYSLDNLTGAGITNGPSGQPWRGIDPKQIGQGRHWRYGPEKLDQLDAEGRIYWPPRGKYPKLKQYLHESGGTTVGDLWTDIPVIGRTAAERLGYPTQKPVALLERIIRASSDEGHIVLDPFCGCGTTVHAAQKLRRRWIGIDVTHLAIALIERRMQAAFPGVAYEVHGVPKDLAGARQLAIQDKHQFQLWAVARVGAQAYRGGKKGADGGIDGVIYFKPDGRRTERAIVSVKGGENVSVAQIRELASVVDRERAKIGVFVTLAAPTRPMMTEAYRAGFYETEQGRHLKIQILTVAEILAGKRPDIPLIDPAAARRAPREDRAEQHELLI